MTKAVYELVFDLSPAEANLEHLYLHAVFVEVVYDRKLGHCVVVAMLVMHSLVFPIALLCEDLEHVSGADQTYNVDCYLGVRRLFDALEYVSDILG